MLLQRTPGGKWLKGIGKENGFFSGNLHNLSEGAIRMKDRKSRKQSMRDAPCHYLQVDSVRNRIREGEPRNGHRCPHGMQ